MKLPIGNFNGLLTVVFPVIVCDDL